MVARPPSALYRLQKAFRRNRLSFLAGGAIALALFMGAGASAWEARQARAESARAHNNLYAAQMIAGRAALEEGNLAQTRHWLDLYRTDTSKMRGWEWRYLWRNSQSDEIKQLSESHDREVTAIAFSSNGRRFASASLDKTVKVWEGSGVQFRPVCTNHSSEIYVGSMAISPDGKTIAAGCRDRFIWLWDVATRQARKWPSAPILDLYKPLAFTPDGATLVISERDGVCLRDVRTGASVGKLPEPGSPTAFAISPDGRVLASGGENGLIRLWDLPAQSPLPGFCLGYKEHIASLAFSPDGAFLAAGCYESIVSVWEHICGM